MTETGQPYTYMLAAVLAAAGCTSRAPEGTATDVETDPTAAEPATASPDDPLAVDFGPLVGRQRLATPTAGRHAVRIQANQRRFLTMEARLDESLDGGASLELRADGSVHACFWSTIRSGGSLGRYQSPDGQDHHRNTTTTTRLGAHGTWVAEPTAARALIELQTLDRQDCEPGATAYQPPTPAKMICHAIDTGGELPTPALVCRPPADQHEIHDVSMALEPNLRTGPWLLREDPTGRHPPAFGPEVQPWLLLGNPGLILQVRDEHEGKPMSIEISAGEVSTPTGPPN